MKYILGTLFTVIFVLTACTPSPEEIATQTAVAYTQTAAAWTPTPLPTATPIPTTGIIMGFVLDNDRKPLKTTIDDNVILIVALLCVSDDSDIECLHEDFWDIGSDVLFDSICEADDTSSKCLLHLGQGAASVEDDGSYTIADVPPGEYQIVSMFRIPGVNQIGLTKDVLSVQAGEITEYDIATRLVRK